jgi:molybdopterin biosynthesis enzyme
MNKAQRLPPSLTPLDLALEAVLRELDPVAANERPPLGASPREAGDMPELRRWPPHDVAAIDGWALRASELVGASSYTPLPLTKQPAWVEAGERIPDGCDCVLDEDSVDGSAPIAQALAETIPGQGIRRKGGEIADPNRILGAWRPGDLHQAMHRPRLRVVNVPGGAITIRLIASNLHNAGIAFVSVEAAARDAASIANALHADSCDLLLLVGGSGVGRTDAAVMALANRGEVLAHGLALEPGRTAAVGRIDRIPVVALPGAPDSALAVWWAVVLPVLDRLSGRPGRETTTLPLARKIASTVGIAELVLLEQREGAWIPLSVGDLALEAVARADAWLVVPPASEGYAAGTPAGAYMLRERESR